MRQFFLSKFDVCMHINSYAKKMKARKPPKQATPFYYHCKMIGNKCTVRSMYQEISISCSADSLV